MVGVRMTLARCDMEPKKSILNSFVRALAIQNEHGVRTLHCSAHVRPLELMRAVHIGETILGLNRANYHRRRPHRF